ncbi:MAG: alpha-ribazole phosphatase family protein [Gammaproteobacteria bacterium]|nr:alpha-ribazole phosphatase family protein [Gammaproteobacteria bacterium]
MNLFNNKMPEQTKIIIIRHGEPASSNDSLEKIFRGVTDDLLTQEGWLQMAKALKSHTHIDQIFTSPLLRCYQFASQYAEKNQIPLKTIEALKEINFGDWDGKPVRLIAEHSAKQLQQFWKNPLLYTPPGGEPVADFKNRVLFFWNDLVVKCQGKTCLLITHGGVQKIILSEVLNMPIEAMHNIEVPYACCSSFEVYYFENKEHENKVHEDEWTATLKSHTPLP